MTLKGQSEIMTGTPTRVMPFDTKQTNLINGGLIDLKQSRKQCGFFMLVVFSSKPLM